MVKGDLHANYRFRNARNLRPFKNCDNLEFPNAVVLNVVGRRNLQMSATERKRKSAKEPKRAQIVAKARFRVKIANNQVSKGLLMVVSKQWFEFSGGTKFCYPLFTSI